MSTKKNSPLKGSPLRNPGQSLDELIESLRNDKALGYVIYPAFFIVLAVYDWVGYLTDAPRQPWLITAVAAGFAIWGGVRLFQIRMQIRNLAQGRDGEKAVGQYLESLRAAGAKIFHDIRGEDFNIDHVVISSRGVFAIETKTISKPSPRSMVKFDGKRILVAGRPLDREPVIQSSAQVTWLGRLLKESTGREIRPHGVVVFPGWFVERSASARGSACWVLEPKELPGWLANEPERLAIEDVALIAFHLSRYLRAL